MFSQEYFTPVFIKIFQPNLQYFHLSEDTAKICNIKILPLSPIFKACGMSYLQIVIHCGESFAIISDILQLFSLKYFTIISDIFTYLSRQLKSATSKISPLSPIFLGYHNEMSGLHVGGTEKYQSYWRLGGQYIRDNGDIFGSSTYWRYRRYF